jgi:hypothetical protein
LDVAEGIHKHYMDFVSGMAKMDVERGRHLAAMFLDQGLWYENERETERERGRERERERACICV